MNSDDTQFLDISKFCVDYTFISFLLEMGSLYIVIAIVKIVLYSVKNNNISMLFSVSIFTILERPKFQIGQEILLKL